MSSQIERMLNEMLASGNVPSELLAAIEAAKANPQKLDELLTGLQAIGADQMGDAPLMNIEDFYRDGVGKYELRWPLPATIPLPCPFEDLDRKTQFFVLFQEFSRREMEGSFQRNSGDIHGADAIADECIERARQLDVKELLARAYEGKMRIAQRRGDSIAEREWMQRAATARRA
jgi:hypothetical protein